jgi:hypothetical protein
MSAPRTAIEALLADLRDRSWRGDAEAQTSFINIGARKSDTAAATLAEIDRMIAAGIWNAKGQTP